MKTLWPNETLCTLAREAVEKYGKALAGIVPKDAALWGWDGSDYVTFYSELLGILAKYESGFDTNETYTEAFKDAKGKRVISRGLLQLSIESANGYGADLKDANELHDPATNLRCAVLIMSRWIERDGVISGGKKGAWRGISRYWATARGRNKDEKLKISIRMVLKNELSAND